MDVPFVRPSITEAECQAAANAVRSGWLSAGPQVQRFGQAFAAHLGVDRVQPTGSCTAAIEIALRLHGFGPDDAVFMSDLSFVSVANVVRHLGATPVLVDVDPHTMSLDPAALAEALASTPKRHKLRPRAVVPTHMYGWPADIEAIGDAMGDSVNQMLLLEDCAHAVGATYGGIAVGAGPEWWDGVTRAAVWSFYATKNLACGEGGALYMPGRMDEAESMALHGMTAGAWDRYGDKGSWWYDVERPGLKANMTDPAAAVGLVQLGRLLEMQLRRQEIAWQYIRGLLNLQDAGLVLPPHPHSSMNQHAWHLFVVQLPEGMNRNAVMHRLLEEHGVGTNVHFSPLHEMTAYRPGTDGAVRCELPVAKAAGLRILSLPMYPDLTDDQVDHVIEAVTDVVTSTPR